MKTIALLAVLAMILQGLIGTASSVGGPLTIMLILFLTMLAVGIYEAWLKKRGALGWIVNIVASVIGGFVAAIFVGMAMEMILPQLHVEGSLASSQHPLLYILLAGMAILTVVGSWGTLQIANRFR
ncbi:MULTISPECIES: hypothetical protein [unclassified Bradyrhizobium]|uniref:hypothetical protein n=1 Tax=unclassified Bradyrhizobium TaxID=2631580 RepID=UPI001BA7697E|nr:MULTISPECIES: hypothetical protein [unclassified Bradyrhizobium]MBR1229835.1 hypothetical protein [Bradyrhizobium sp. AUGA SZCCT0176]MBR1232287.1 hypothetical protein [Bradyrhizobium sp. AUGA SZCCT0182]MBR1281906.1 hypothetical protein [Bradyrhizobium sp. AUGA SZCCT0177]MBR1297695.1 hypothetical protein [Bradyrhizobium sp. AUGA SZCCT0042]